MVVTTPERCKFFRLNPTAEDFCREGYYGAYVYPGVDNNLHYDVVSYDVTAAYGARMRYLYPVGSPTYSTEYITTGTGMWDIHVKCIDAKLPIVPYRKDHDSGVYWLGIPGDECDTIAITAEIEYYKTHGYEVTVKSGLWWSTLEPVFSSFIDKVEKVESINTTTKQCAKIMRNALYGRFGTKKFHERVVITNNPSDECVPYSDPKTGKFIEYLYTIEEELDVAYIMPHWAAHVTAYQRLAMYDLIYLCGPENCLGCDTDSIKTYRTLVEEKGLPISETEYGKGKIEASFDVYRSHGPKNYVGLLGDKYYMKSKGIPKKAITADMMKNHLHRDEDTVILVEFVSITKSISMMKSDAKKAFNIPRHRTLSSLKSDKWTLTNGLFKPVGNIV